MITEIIHPDIEESFTHEYSKAEDIMSKRFQEYSNAPIPIYFIPTGIPKMLSTHNISFPEPEIFDSSTWVDLILDEDNFDIFSNVRFNKKIKVDVHITNISKYKPKIVIE